MPTRNALASLRPGRVLTVALLLGASACGGDALTDPAVLQIGGQWSFTESYTDSQLSISCSNQSSLTLTQSGSTFSGTSVQTGTCTDPDGTFDNSGTFQLRNGTVAGSNVTWNDDGTPVCQYTGAITGTPPNRMSGTVACTGVISGVSYNLTGTWQMTR